MISFARISPIFFSLVLLSCVSINKPPPPLVDTDFRIRALHGTWYIHNSGQAGDLTSKPAFQLHETNVFVDQANILCLFTKMRSEDPIENLSAILNTWQPQNLENCPKFTFFPTKNGIDIRKTGESNQYPIFRIDFLDLKENITLQTKQRGRLYSLYVEIDMGRSSAGFMGAQNNQQPLMVSRLPAVVVTGK